jgi:hypothetical protein
MPTCKDEKWGYNKGGWFAEQAEKDMVEPVLNMLVRQDKNLSNPALNIRVMETSHI